MSSNVSVPLPCFSLACSSLILKQYLKSNCTENKVLFLGILTT